MNIQDISIGDRFFALFIGPTGTTKTTQAASFYEAFEEDGRYIQFFSFDGKAKLEIIKVRFPKAKNIYAECYGPENFSKFGNDFGRILDDPKCAMIVIDSYTSFSLTVIAFQMHMKGHGMTIQNAINGVKTTNSKGGIVVPDWAEFNGEATIASELLDYCKGSDKHVIWIAHPVLRTEVKNEGGKQVAKKYTSIAAFGPKVADLIPGYFGEIYCLEVQQGLSSLDPTNTLVYTTPKNGFPGRTNFGLPDCMNITNKTLYQVLKEEMKANNMPFMNK
jgi:hypothetical protein